MEALFSSLVAKYGFDVAAKLLGIDKQEQNPKYAISLGNINLNPMNMIQRAGLNQGIKSLMGGNLSGIMGPAALLGGAVMLGRAFDPMRPGSRNYSPNLAGQVDYLSGISGMIGRNPDSGLMQYGPGSVLRGQNVSSMFGTNNYQTQLQNYIDKLEAKKAKGYNTIGFGKFKTTNFTEGQQKLLDKALAEKKTFFDKKADIRDKAKVKSAAPTYTPPNIHSGGGGHAGGASAAAAAASQAADDRAAGAGGYYRGGIASL